MNKIDGDSVASGGHSAAELLPLVYRELHAIAEQRLRSLSPGSTLHPTELVHEAFLRLGKSSHSDWESRRHFIAAAAMAMRSILIDRARARNSLKRGGGAARIDLEHVSVDVNTPSEHVLEVDRAISRLEAHDPRSAQVVLLRFYLGLPDAAIAGALGVTERTVRRDWAFARSWLKRDLGQSERETPPLEQSDP